MAISSKLQAAKMAVTSSFGRQILKSQKNAPEILFVVGMAGFVGTTVLACKATLNLDKIMNEHNNKRTLADELYQSGHEDYSKKDYRQDIAMLRIRQAKDLTKLYGPTIICGTVTVLIFAKSHRILNTRNAGLMAAYAALDKGFNEYRQRVIAEVGPEKDREYRFGTEHREIIHEGENGPEITNKKTFGKDAANSVYARLFDEFNKNWSPTPEYNMMFLRAQQNYCNDVLQSRGHITLNDVYDELGIDRSQPGFVVGWIKGQGDNFVDFGIFDDSSADRFHDFITGREGALLLDFNVDGVIYDKI